MMTILRVNSPKLLRDGVLEGGRTRNTGVVLLLRYPFLFAYWGVIDKGLNHGSFAGPEGHPVGEREGC